MEQEHLWTEVTRTLKEAADQGFVGNKGIGLDVYDARCQLVYSQTFGNFSRKKHYQIGSASKWITTTVLLSLVNDGILSLEDTTAKWLEWKGKKGEITIRHLMSLTSGFHIPPMEAPRYFYDQGESLKSCTDSVCRDYELIGAPGKIASYGPAGFIIAGRIAEVATGKQWSHIFWERLGDPLGFDRENTRYDPPQQLAGSLVMSMEEYGRFLEMINNRGSYRGKRILNPELIGEQMKDQWASNTRIESSPYSVINRSFHYGLGVWRECPDLSDIEACDRGLIVTCAGMFGWYPWIDMKNNSYGLLAMVKRFGSTPPGYVVAFRLLEKLRPIINSTLVKPRTGE